MTNPDSILKTRDITLPTKVHRQICGFSSSHVWVWELDHKEGWESKNWCFHIVLEKTLESSLDCKEIKPVNPKGNQSWIFIGRLMLKLKLQYLGHLMRRAVSLEKSPVLRETEGNNRGWDGYIASPTQRTWIWANSRRQRRTEEPGVLQSIESQSQTWLSDWITTTKKDNTQKIHSTVSARWMLMSLLFFVLFLWNRLDSILTKTLFCLLFERRSVVYVFFFQFLKFEV